MPRARPLPPEKRRDAILQAAGPLLIESGAELSTRQIAEAAGVAEGTLFRVFDSKDDIIAALIARELDPQPLCTDIAAIDPRLPLLARVAQIIALLQERITRVSALLTALLVRDQHARPKHDAEEERRRGAMVTSAIVRALGPDADGLRLPAPQTAGLIWGIAFANAHPLVSGEVVTDPELLAHSLLHGLLQETT